MNFGRLRAKLLALCYETTIFRAAYIALFIVTALFSAAASLALLSERTIGLLAAGMVSCHVLLVVATQLCLRLVVLRNPRAHEYPEGKYRFCGWVVLRNSLIHVGVYLFFALLSTPAFRRDPFGGDYEAAAAFLLLAIMSGAFVALRGRSTIDAAHHS
jgi:hypothetical protein